MGVLMTEIGTDRTARSRKFKVLEGSGIAVAGSHHNRSFHEGLYTCELLYTVVHSCCDATSPDIWQAGAGDRM